MRKLWLIPLSLMALLLVLAASLWLARARLAGEIAETYFRDHGIASSFRFSRLTMSGLAGRVALGPADAPDFSAASMEVDFDKLQWRPRIVAVRLTGVVIRARLSDSGKVTLPSLQEWLDSLSSTKGHSPYVSDDLSVSLSGLSLLLATPAGPLDLDGSATVKAGVLVAADLVARPGALAWKGWQVRLGTARLKLDTVNGGYGAVAHFEGAVRNAGLESAGVSADIDAPAIRWAAGGQKFSIPALNVKAVAASLAAGGITASHPHLDLALHALSATTSGDFDAEISAATEADLSPGALPLPVISRDKKLTEALRGNLRHLQFALNAKAARTNGKLDFSLTQPLDIKGAKAGVLHLAAFALGGPPAALTGQFAASLFGPGLPAISLSARNVQIRQGGFTANTSLKTHFDFAMLHGADLNATATLSFKNGVLALRLSDCAPVRLAAFHPANADLAQNINGALCPAAGETTLSAASSGWKFKALASGAQMALPLGPVAIGDGTARISFSGRGGDFTGKISISRAVMHDALAPRRFEPVTGAGDIALDKGVWRGSFNLSDGRKDALGQLSFSHSMASGSGQMTISAPQLQFAQGKLQPNALSPLLGSFTRVQGAARFAGMVRWTPQAVESSGTLHADDLEFLTPLGTAHAVKADIVFTSLFPPATAPNQHVAISKVDWALPLSGLAIDFSFGAGKLRLDNFSTAISEGNLHLGALTIDLAGPNGFSGAADLTGLSLAPLVAAFNLGAKVKLEGKVTGKLPFSYGPDGFRVRNGHVQASGPGRISIDRSLWEQGGATAGNAVQDLAYQAMQHLAYDQLSIDINSVPGGRLQMVFHIKGHSDPPQPQQAEVAIADILNDSALQKTIALPSNTPIDLTLDTTLNFDELLKSYADAWSKALGRQSN